MPIIPRVFSCWALGDGDVLFDQGCGVPNLYLSEDEAERDIRSVRLKAVRVDVTVTEPDSGPPEGFLQVGTNGRGEVVINHPDLKPDAAGVGHIVFSPAQARGLAKLLNKSAAGAAQEKPMEPRDGN